ncbi:hypothetical protein [Hahella ganghwensis]|uniref:hypothetical protein n=1 Tax=Hahella ganghwensis TaxID=286420 RepID=UPI00037BD27F|nr:hypothetical protein [Hahella ganghwensis]
MKLKMLVLVFMTSTYASANPAKLSQEQSVDGVRKREIETLEAKLKAQQTKYFPCEVFKYLDNGFPMTENETEYMHHVWGKVEDVVTNEYRRQEEKSFMGILEVNMEGNILGRL